MAIEKSALKLSKGPLELSLSMTAQLEVTDNYNVTFKYLGKSH